MHQDFSKYQPGEPRRPDEIEAGIIISPDTRRAERLPPGQVRTRKWPVLHHGQVPVIPTDQWRFDVSGLVAQPRAWSWDEFQQLPRARVFSDFHCVTRWSRLDNLWEGVSMRTLLDQVGVLPQARFAMVHAYDDGWTTNLPLEFLAAEDALLADRHDGEPLSADHGGPVRLVVPMLYAWKSAKWVRGVELTATDRPGFWERAGYHNRGNPWTEERYGW